MGNVNHGHHLTAFRSFHSGYEDEILIALELSELFEAQGAKVSIASTPAHALHLVEQLVFSAAVLDCGPGESNDAELCRALGFHGVPFMFYTGYDDLDGRPSGAPVVTKPASGLVLVDTVMQLLNVPTPRHLEGLAIKRREYAGQF